MNKAREKMLLVRLRQFKDERSFTELYEAMADAIYRFIYFKVGDSEIAKDLTSDVFLRGWKTLTDKKSREVRHLKPFLYTVARNVVTDYYRSGRQGEVSIEAIKSVESKEELSKTIQIKVDSAQVFSVMRVLKDAYQEILLLRYVNELSLKEIAQVLDKSNVATRVLLHRAQQALKREYEKIAN